MSDREIERERSWRASVRAAGPRTDEVPADVWTAAASADLGEHRRTFGSAGRTSRKPSIPLVLIVSAAFGCLVTWLFVPSPEPGPFVGIALGAAVVLALVITLLGHITSAASNWMTPDLVWVFERGFLDRKRRSGELRTFPFARCRFFRNTTRHYTNGVPTHTSYQYVVRRDDGETVDLQGESQLSGWVQVLGETIAAAISETRVHAGRAALGRGQRIDFGEIALEPAGISVDGQLLPWGDVAEIDVAKGKLRIHRRGGLFSWSRSAVPEIPDVDALLVLAEEARRAG
jgi:hypothetical protein